MAKKYEFMVGEKHNMLTYVSDAESRRSSSGISIRRVNCKCDCGETVVIDAGSFKQGHTKSCGCWKIKATSLLMSKNNTYEIDGEVTKVFDDRGNFTLIDTEDLEKIKDRYFWKTRKLGRGCGGYWITAPKENPNSKILLHRFLTGVSSGMLVDHLNHDKSDNRKENLIICDAKDNMRNYPVIGIVFIEHANKWQISVGNKEEINHIGVFDTFDEALEAYRPFIDGGNFNEPYR